MARTGLQIEGLQEITRRIGSFRQNLFNEMGSIAKEAADIVRDEARARAPAGETGELKAGIISAVTWDKNKSKAFAGAGMDKAKNDIFVKFSATGKRYYYPASVEYGHGDPKRGERPFLRVSLKKKKTAVKNHISSRVRALVEGAR
ncbi:HK97 gp10 family phage protein [Desulfosporosinus lacus]|uniref:Bacteriophage HK97-gp10, putative tail-component n=1 Tax=Desulfosporosinus lacus DSM 15449 TaxID=1121420 RepID=A0A1M5WGY6_9FIRM|nr:HK97 gp10 family phage protein [Desulfosporosinus lacus]SHH86628.1 Bacteriophage HK97-gp10, putative tail-component [Desulfosporosinus lacus DSM 15449]